MSLTAKELLFAKSKKLAPNFTLYEFIRSSNFPELVEFPSDEIIEQLGIFAKNVIQPIRDEFGMIFISSGYRNAKLNKKVGGVNKSVHAMYDKKIFLGTATDIVPMEEGVKVVFDWIIKNKLALSSLKCGIIYRNPKVVRNPFIHVDSGEFRKNIQFLEKVNNARAGYVNYDGE